MKKGIFKIIKSFQNSGVLLKENLLEKLLVKNVGFSIFFGH